MGRFNCSSMRIFSSYRSHFIAAAAFAALAGTSPVAKGAAANSLANISVRAPVGAGEAALFTSFLIEGTTSKSVLLRGVGPALALFGVPGTLSDPVLTLYNGSGTSVSANDDWGGNPSLSSAFANVGAFPLPQGSRDAALVALLAPGSYTARIAGANGTTG